MIFKLNVLKISIAIFTLANSGLAVAQGGTVATWGGEWITPPTNLGNCKDISMSYGHAAAIQDSGSVICWGQNGQGQCNPPSDLGPCKAITAGGFANTSWGCPEIGFTVAIQETGNVVAWGCTGNNVPTDLGMCVKVAAGWFHCLAIKANGNVAAWGSNSGGQIDVPPSLGPCIEIAGGPRNSLALKSDGYVVCWGDNSNNESTPPSDLGQCKSIAACGTGQVSNFSGAWIDYKWRSTSIAVKLDGSVVAWGSSAGIISGIGPCTKIAAGSAAWRDDYPAGFEYYVALQENGKVVSWGGTPSPPLDLGACVLIGAGRQIGIAIKAPPSTISGVLPISGPASGSTNISITGSGFIPTSQVTIGGNAATNVVVVSETQITATTPEGFPGPAVVTVNLTSSTAFYYRPSCASDIDNNGVVDNADLGILLLDYGSCSESAAATELVEPVRIQMIEQQPKPASKNK